MTKQEVSQRVLQNGKPLSEDKFTWDCETKTFSTKESNLVIFFKYIANCTFKTDSDCTFDAGYNCIFTCKKWCVVIRRDIYEVIEIPEDTTIKLYGSFNKGYDVVEPEPETIEIDGKRYNKADVEERLKELKTI